MGVGFAGRHAGHMRYEVECIAVTSTAGRRIVIEEVPSLGAGNGDDERALGSISPLPRRSACRAAEVVVSEICCAASKGPCDFSICGAFGHAVCPDLRHRVNATRSAYPGELFLGVVVAHSWAMNPRKAWRPAGPNRRGFLLRGSLGGSTAARDA